MPVPYGSKLHIPPASYHLLAVQQEPYNKVHLLTKTENLLWNKMSGEWTMSRKMTRQKEQLD